MKTILLAKREVKPTAENGSRVRASAPVIEYSGDGIDGADGSEAAQKSPKTPNFPVENNSPRGAVEEVAPGSLRLHPALAEFPQMSSEESKRLESAVREAGKVLVPLLINSRREILDGRHRWQIAGLLKLKSVPVAVVDDADPLALAISTALDRRNLTKSGIALIVFLKHPELGENATARQVSGLKRGKSQGGESNSFHRLADRYQVPPEYFTDLVKIKAQSKLSLWKKLQTEILAGKKSIGGALAASNGALVKKGGPTKTEPEWVRLAKTTLEQDLITRLNRKFEPENEQMLRNLFCEALKKIRPAFIRGIAEPLVEIVNAAKRRAAK